MEVGQRYNWKGVLGKLMRQDGGIIYFSTPHGTVMRMGLLQFDWGLEELTDELAEKLASFEVDAKLMGVDYRDGVGLEDKF